MFNIDLVNTAEAAKRLGVHTRSIARMVERGYLVPAVRGAGIRGPLFFTAEEIERVKLERTS